MSTTAVFRAGPQARQPPRAAAAPGNAQRYWRIGVSRGTDKLEELATRVEAQGFRPYVIPVGGSNALGALGYVESALEIAQQCEGAVNISSVVVASGSAGTHAGLAVGLEHLMPESELIGVTVSRSVADQLPKVVNLQQAIAKELELTASAEILLWDDYFAPGYGVPKYSRTASDSKTRAPAPRSVFAARSAVGTAFSFFRFGIKKTVTKPHLYRDSCAFDTTASIVRKCVQPEGLPQRTIEAVVSKAHESL